ncbi:uncharacterized protein LOC131026028 [Salvia miltiorrhiza]|uniref:uncharacterized protein LOC131026028 n=1 Tax=Salvia miltiorrhiza TaxID=226208 RepID=UPI0025ABBEA4|nr:uncharacterized protein LOC131026028 [Salvia miltiorrhiza]
MANSDWKRLFPEATLTSLTAPMSDHVPLLLMCKGGLSLSNSQRFRFENKWCLEPNLPNVIRDFWLNLHGVTVTDRLTAMSESLSIWALYNCRNSNRSKKDLQNQISIIQGKRDSGSIAKLFKIRKELADVLLREEVH